ncbi:MAG: dienelactone hydrolase family protein [Hoeflea sp.]|uniref:dienelactone hydrolase family protein n=1 Tax=Hoeflea sp. TaxID=1940281 RepID=UPI0032EEA608
MSKIPTITQDMINAYDEYTHLTLDRRAFMGKLKLLTGSAAAAATVAPLLAASSARAAMVAEDDPRLAVSEIAFDGASGPMAGQLSLPEGRTELLPAVVVIHENRGLNAHIRDVARRLALEGFATLAVDFLSPEGGTPDNEDQAREMIRALDGAQTLANARAARAFLADHEATTGKVGAIGFCWGGGLVNTLATADPQLGAGVAYYGRQAAASEVPAIEAPLLLHYAGLDERINAGIEDYRTALEAAGKDFEIHVYEGVNHAFNNDTSAARYDKQAADLAWSRTVAFLKDRLG